MRQVGIVSWAPPIACRQKEGARRADEAAKRVREAEAERARRAAYSEALRREAERTAAILAKQVALQPLCGNGWDQVMQCLAGCVLLDG